MIFKYYLISHIILCHYKLYAKILDMFKNYNDKIVKDIIFQKTQKLF